MIIVAGHLRVAAGGREEYLAAVAGITAQARRSPGCHDFVQSADPIDPERINIFERWDDDEALMAFRSSGADDDEASSAPAVRDADVAKYLVSAVESP